MINPGLEIIKSPEAEKMRQMVTQGFYDRSRIGLWMFEVIGREYDDMAEWARSLRYEAFPQTCTWSIAIWKFVYGVEPDETLPLELRRQRLLAQKLKRPPINPARIETVLSKLTGCPVRITENVTPYTFRVDVDESGGTIYEYKAALKTLRDIKPSHLSFRYESEITVEYTTTDYSVTTMAECFREYIIGDESLMTTNIVAYDFGAVTGLLREYIMADESLIQTDTVDSDTGAVYELTHEDIWDGKPIRETVGSYDSGATSEFVKEVYTE